MNSKPLNSPSDAAATNPDLLNLLAAELERPRSLSAQVTRHLSGTHGVERDSVGAFLTNELPKLEDYEIDLALAPIFTPSLQDQSVFAELLGAETVPTDSWPALVRALVNRPTIGHLITEDGHTHAVSLRAVSIERFVHRLRLHGTIPPALLELIATRIAPGDQPLLRAIARRAVWENEARQKILQRFLERSLEHSSTQLTDAVELLKLLETYEPADTADLLARVPQWEIVLRHEISGASSPKPFFNERVQELHGGGRDQRARSAVEPKQAELDFLTRLKTILSEPV